MNIANGGNVIYHFTGDKSNLDKTTNSVTSSFKGLTKSLLAVTGITKAVSAGFNLIKNSMGDAISRYDTLKNFPKVMSNLGIASKDATKSITKMSNKLAGLPTTLDQGALAVQRFTSANGDVKKSTNLFLALNNAILAGGASSEIQANALEQLSQAYSKGKPDMMEWRSAMTAMPAQLKQVATAMGYINADELGEDLRKGNVSMDEFMDTIVELNEKGLPGFKNFETQARNSTGGIATSITVAKTQVVKGVASMIEGLNTSLKKSGFGSISDIITKMGKTAKKVLDDMGKRLAKVNFKKLISDVKKLIPLIKVVGVSFASWKIGNTLKDFNSKLSLAKKGLSLFSSAVAKTKSQQGLLSTVIGKSTTVLKSFSSTTGATTSATKILTSALGSTSSIMAALPFVGAVAGAGLLAYGIYKVVNSTDEYIKKANQQIAVSKKVIENQQKANEEMNKTISSKGAEMQYYENLRIELQSIVDENGHIKQGYEERAKTITGVLASALGVEANIVDGVIQGYQEYNKAVDQSIEKKKAKIILDEQEKQYSEAIKNQASETKKMAKAQQEVEKWERKIAEARKELNKIDKNSFDSKSRIDELTKQITNYTDYLEKEKKVYKTSKTAFEEYANDIIVYEKNLANFNAGNYNQMITDVQGYVANLSNNLEKKKKITESDLLDEEATLNALKKMKKKTNSDIYDEEIRATEERIKVKQSELGTIKTQISEERNTWIVGTQQTLSQLTGQTIKFKDLGNGFVQAYVDGQKAGAPVAYNNLETFAGNITKSLNKNAVNSSKEAKTLVKKYADNLANGDSKKKTQEKGKQIADSTLKGISSKQSSFKTQGYQSAKGVAEGATSSKSLSTLYSSGVRMAKELEKGYKSAAKIHSPSKLFADLSAYIPMGVAKGIYSNIGAVTNAMKSMVSSMSSSFNISPQLASTSSLHYSPNVIVNNQMNMTTDPLGQVVGQIKTFANGSQNDYNYGMGA